MRTPLRKALKSMSKSLFRRAAIALGLGALFASPLAAASPVQAAHPALWEVSDADTKIYLFGTIHLLPDNIKWHTAKFDQAVQQSQQLIVETIVDEKNPATIMSAMASLAFDTPNLPPLVDRVSPDKRQALAAAIKKSGFPPQAFDRMETWAAAFILLGNQYRDMHLKGTDGVVSVLRSTFSTNGKPIGELETNLEQFGFFDRLSEKAQDSLLEGALDSSKSADAEFSGMLKAWSKGDVKGIARTFDHDLSGSPELAQALLHQRNANWSKWIERRMAQPGTVMIAVGAGHLAGSGSVIALLQRDGYRVRRVQ